MGGNGGQGGGSGGGLVIPMGGQGGMRGDNAFCEVVVEGGAGGAIDCGSTDASPHVTSDTFFRYDILEKNTYQLTFDRPVCDAADNTGIAPGKGGPNGDTPEDRDRGLTVTYADAPGAYDVAFDAGDWKPLDTFDITVRIGVSDTECIDFMAQPKAVKVMACHPNGWPSSQDSCRAAPPSALDNGLDKNDCKVDSATGKDGRPLSFYCGKAAVEGSMPSQPAPPNPDNPAVSDLHAHAYRLTAYMDGDYVITLDGTQARTATSGATSTLIAEKTCEDVNCTLLESYVTLDIGSTCGGHDEPGKGHLVDENKTCLVQTTLNLKAGDVRYLTVRPDSGQSCGPAKDQSCDYNYALWVRGPDGN
jgi:hypothetical protein